MEAFLRLLARRVGARMGFRGPAEGGEISTTFVSVVLPCPSCGARMRRQQYFGSKEIAHLWMSEAVHDPPPCKKCRKNR